MIRQDIFSEKNKKEKLTMSSALVMIGALRINDLATLKWRKTQIKIFTLNKKKRIAQYKNGNTFN